MENPFAKFSRKDWLYVGGAVASIVALVAFIVIQKRSQVTYGTGTISDIPNSVPASPLNATNYLGYNTGGPPIAPPIAAGADVSPDNSGTSCCCANNDCAGPSPLSSGDTFSGLTALLNYYQNTNPNYVALQAAMTQQYADYFATGATYSGGAVSIGVSPA
jgi:hypothetical protein